jgi:hypothetical protein
MNLTHTEDKKMNRRFCTSAVALLALTSAGAAFADTTCLTPQLSIAQLQETGDQQLNEANCSTGDSTAYESLMHMSGWSGFWTAPSCVGAKYPKQRFLNTVRLIDKAEAANVYSVRLDDGWELAQEGVSNRPVCNNSSAWATTFSNRIEYGWRFFYNGTVIDRAATIIHEATHSGRGKSHVSSGDVTIIGTNSCTMKLTSCDSSWSYGGAWMQEVKWLEEYAKKGSFFVTNPNARRMAMDVANWDLNNAFVQRPMVGGVPRTATCVGC